MYSQLGAEAKSYVLERLADGRTFSKLLVPAFEGLDLLIGTFLPEPVAREELMKFQVGGKIPSKFSVTRPDGTRITRIETTEEILVDLVDTHFGAPAQAFFMLEDSMARAKDPWLERFEYRPFFQGEEVYHFFARGFGDQNALRTAVRAVWHSWPPIVGAFGLLPEKELRRIGAQKKLTVSDLGLLAGATRSLCVGAYDGESFLFCEPIGSAGTSSPKGVRPGIGD